MCTGTSTGTDTGSDSGTDTGLGIVIGKIWYRKKVSEPLSDNVGTKKITRPYRYRKYLVPEKVLVSVSFNILGTLTH